MKKRVFISHSTEDGPRVKSIVDSLRSRGLPAFLHDSEIYDPTTIAAGANVREEIMNAIRSSSTVLAIWSTKASTSPWVNYELGLASALGKQIQFVLVDENAPEPPGDLAVLPMLRLK